MLYDVVFIVCLFCHLLDYEAEVIQVSVGFEFVAANVLGVPL